MPQYKFKVALICIRKDQMYQVNLDITKEEEVARTHMDKNLTRKGQHHHNCTKMDKTLQETKNKDLIQGPQVDPERQELMDSMQTTPRCQVPLEYQVTIIRTTHNQQVYKME